MIKRIIKQIIFYEFFRDSFLTLKSRINIQNILKKKTPILLEIGAGDKPGQRGWITLDLTKQCDIYWDLRNGIPFPSNSVHKIYSSHLFEHLTFKEAQILLKQCHRALTSNGTFSICVPNARIYLEAYVKNMDLDSRFFNFHQAHNKTTKIDYINYIAYMDGHHKYMFDEQNLIHILTLAGFKDVKLREFDSTIDLKARDYESIYAEAKK